ncbi:MAG: DUF4956 domain-containing protein [Candidatus Latescibacterota bacterium]|jgi:uncharacterized membrane protein YhiD involved in acid resistance
MNLPLELDQALSFSLTAGGAARNLAIALGCGILVAGFYSWAAPRQGNGRSFIGALVILTMITTVVIMVIGNNLARAFGLVGAMSIIRFRTAVKDVRDIAFIFFSLTVGMAAGVGQPGIALVATLFIGLIAVAISRMQSRVGRRRDFLLQLAYTPTGEGEALYLPVLRQYCRQHHLVNSRLQDDDRLELSFTIRLRDELHSAELVRALGRLGEIHHVNLFSDQETE